MTDTATEPEEEAPKPSKMPLILGLVAGLLGAGGGFFATYSGMILGSDESAKVEEVIPKLEPIDIYSYVPIEPFVVSLAPENTSKHLRFSAQLEVHPDYKSDVEAVMPRIIDLLNGYLRAVKVTDLENPATLIHMRAQMLHRVQIVTGRGRVNDLLIMEFVLT
jgi:flagellar FliL protein